MRNWNFGPGKIRVRIIMSILEIIFAISFQRIMINDEMSLNSCLIVIFLLFLKSELI